MFNFNPLEVGNPMTLGMIEEENDERFDDLINYIVNGTEDGCFDTIDDLIRAIDNSHINFSALSNYQKNVAFSLVKEH